MVEFKAYMQHNPVHLGTRLRIEVITGHGTANKNSSRSIKPDQSHLLQQTKKKYSLFGCVVY